MNDLTIDHKIQEMNAQLRPYEYTSAATASICAIAQSTYLGYKAGTGEQIMPTDLAIMMTAIVAWKAYTIPMFTSYIPLTYKPFKNVIEPMSKSKMLASFLFRITALSLCTSILTQITSGIGYATGYAVGHTIGKT